MIPLVSTSHVAHPEAVPKEDKLMRAARDFESIFLKSMLKELEKSSSFSGKSGISAGKSQYGGMVVDTFADAISAAGGTGLADVIARALRGDVEPTSHHTSGRDFTLGSEQPAVPTGHDRPSQKELGG